MPESPGRQTGIDVIRIVSMLLITATHYIGYSGLLDSEDILPVNRILFTVILILARAALNLFAIMTGYLLAKKPFSFKRITRIWFDTVFISVVGLVIAAIFRTTASRGVLLKSLFPITTFSYWYINAHMMLLCIAPVINMLIESMNARAHFLLCCMMTTAVSIFLVMNPFVDSQIYVGHAHGVIWFSILYLWGGYFSRNEIVFSRRIAALTWAAALTILLLAGQLQRKVPLISQLDLFSTNSVFMIIVALSIFILLKDTDIKGKLKKPIRVAAEVSLFVYLIQEHNALRDGFWSLFQTAALAGTYEIWLDFLIAMVCLWPFAFFIKKTTDFLWRLFDKILFRLQTSINNE